ncbi:DUF1576 domain-containing protein [Vagococcus sp. BWB3-3]|uniref:DUF1576 domain-containing protein n=1 Tax=Vagococcus allomyrinae TaxID=2794353 RepID=A0A940P7M9_9ENTE|nr:DUF1576 domain-containing protein [Vagococcus allomyrinae]MBP1039954.1 DUF1576 domain-containing protein [Vagococcus allomyrinae]
MNKRLTATQQLQRKVSEKIKYRLVLAYSLMLIGMGCLFDPLSTIFRGLWTISLSSNVLITDYIEIAGLGAAFVNSGLLTLLSVLVARGNKVKMSGPLIAALYTMSGFSFFGKNLLNSLTITLGVYLYAKCQKKPFSNYLIVSLFGTALAPAVSLVAFGSGLPLVPGILLGFLTGVTIGFVLPPLATQFLSFHQGFSLYNVGFTAGIIGMVFTAIMRMFKYDISNVYFVSSGNNLLLSIVLYVSFTGLFVIGWWLNERSFSGLSRIFHSSGKLVSDFATLEGYGVTLINMGMMGMAATSYVLLIGGQLSGAVIGGIYTVVGFSAYGCHLRNSIPIVLGVYLMALLTGGDPSDVSVLLTALFGTTLAPVAGYYGPVAGLLAGGLHMALVSNVGFLHGGVNLYNNGFSGGFIAAFLVPILDSFAKMKEARESQH